MSVSVYTPSHDPRYLDEAYESLKAQTCAEWEWVVALNQGAQWASPPDPRVHVFERDVDGVGAAKRAAVAECRGELLVELDHDDILAPTALKQIQDELHDSEFVYTDFAQVTEHGDYCPDRFDLANGWQYHEEDIAGRHVLTCESMEPSPHNASLIWFEPNHAKAFTRDLYDKAGGYSDRDILDDQDLMCRMYQHTEFAHIPECLYLQRMHPGNTQRQKETNDRIQRETIALYDSYIQSNALAWSRRQKLEALDLGAAHNPTPGYLTVDLEGDVDYRGDVYDILRSMEDSSVGVMRAVDLVEHLPDMIGFMNEAYRVLAHGGMLLTLTPSTDGRGAFQDPTHINFMNENSWWYYTKAEFAKYVPRINCRFQTSRMVTYFPSDFHRAHDISYVCANLICIKDGPRNGGRLEI